MIGTLFNEVLYRPLINLLFLIYENIASDLGIAIIILTIVIRFVLLPIFYKSAKDQAIMQKIAPQIKEIQKNNKDDKEKQVKEMMAIYKDHKVSPFSGFILLLVQLPILIALYRVFLGGLSSVSSSLMYSFVSFPADINYNFIGLIDLHNKNVVLIILAAVFQFLQSWLILRLSKKDNKQAASPAEKVSKQMGFIGPILTIVILYSLPSAVALYWLTTSAFSVVQQLIINKKIQKNEGNSGNS